MKKRFINWREFGWLAEELSRLVKGRFKIDLVIGIARGGLPLSLVVADRLGVPIDFINVKSYKGIGIRDKPKVLSTLSDDLSGKSILIVDDLVDEGDTMKIALEFIRRNFYATKIYTAALFIKPWSQFKPDIYLDQVEEWIVFPWEVGEFLERK